MPTYSRRSNISTDKLRAEDVEALIDAARGHRGVAGGFGVEVTSTRSGVEYRLDPDAENQAMIRQMFLGRIVDQGPNGESDFTDARYWVEEVIELSGRLADIDALPNFKLYDQWRRAAEEDDRKAVEAAVEAAKGEDVPLREDVQAPRHGYWYPAVNLSELRDGTHGTPEGTLVEVRLTQNMAGRWLFYFQTGGTGSEVRFGVVRDVLDGNSDVVIVEGLKFQSPFAACFTDPQTVDDFPEVALRRAICTTRTVDACMAEPGNILRFEDEDERRTFCETAIFDERTRTFDGDPGPVAVWPGLVSGDYRGLVFAGDTILPRTQIIEVTNIEGVWHAKQTLRWKTHKLPISARITDCSLVRFVSGLLGRGT